MEKKWWRVERARGVWNGVERRGGGWRGVEGLSTHFDAYTYIIFAMCVTSNSTVAKLVASFGTRGLHSMHTPLWEIIQIN